MKLDIFESYSNTKNDFYLPIDATGYVVRKLKDQKPVYFYAMVFKAGEDPSNEVVLYYATKLHIASVCILIVYSAN